MDLRHLAASFAHPRDPNYREDVTATVSMGSGSNDDVHDDFHDDDVDKMRRGNLGSCSNNAVNDAGGLNSQIECQDSITYDTRPSSLQSNINKGQTTNDVISTMAETFTPSNTTTTSTTTPPSFPMDQAALRLPSADTNYLCHVFERHRDVALKDLQLRGIESVVVPTQETLLALDFDASKPSLSLDFDASKPSISLDFDASKPFLSLNFDASKPSLSLLIFMKVSLPLGLKALVTVHRKIKNSPSKIKKL